MGHIGKLVRADVELLRQYLPVPGCLIEHIDEVAVLKDVLNLAGGQQVLDILGDAGGDAAPFPKAFPDFHAPTCKFPLQKQVELIAVVAGGLASRPVDGDTVPHLIVIGNPPLLPYLPIW